MLHCYFCPYLIQHFPRSLCMSALCSVQFHMISMPISMSDVNGMSFTLISAAHRSLFPNVDKYSYKHIWIMGMREITLKVTLIQLPAPVLIQCHFCVSLKAFSVLFLDLFLEDDLMRTVKSCQIIDNWTDFLSSLFEESVPIPWRHQDTAFLINVPSEEPWMKNFERCCKTFSFSNK